MCCPEGETDTADTNHTITTVSLVGGGSRAAIKVAKLN